MTLLMELVRGVIALAIDMTRLRRSRCVKLGLLQHARANGIQRFLDFDFALLEMRIS